MENHAWLDPEIASFYGLGEEQARVTTEHELEGVRTRDILARFLPPPPCVVLDVGGGAGAYAVALAEQGYAVHLVDPVASHVEQARGSAAEHHATLASASLGDARSLRFDDETADAVLLLGPLYHLTERDDRLAALREAHRVLRPGGIVLAAAISRFVSLYDWIVRDLLHHEGGIEMVERDLRDGQHRNPTRQRGWFTTAFFHHPDELKTEVEDSGLALLAMLAVEGPGQVLADPAGWLADPGRRERLLQAIRLVEQEPSILGASAHFIAAARRS